MKTTAFIAMSLALLLGACTPESKNNITVEPLSLQEQRAVQMALRTGRDVDTLPDGGLQQTDCEAPEFFGMNIKGSVTVPEDYSQPQGRQIQVYYYGRLKPKLPPVVFFNGGPASDSHGSSRILEDFLQSPDAQKLSFIYMDQRGTGCSTPYPTDPTVETVNRLAHYGSAEIVRDAEVIREKLLGAQGQWKIFGQSYGGLIVHRYAVTAASGVSAAYAHGFSLMKNQLEWMKLRVKSQKRVVELYFQQYPQDRAALEKLKTLIKEDLCFDQNGSKICGPKVLDALTIFLGFSNSWGTLNRYVTSLQKDGELDMDVLKKFVRYFVFGVYNNNGLAGSVISLTEIAGSQDSDQDDCIQVQEQLRLEGENPEAWPINECRLLAGLQNDQWNQLLKELKVRNPIDPIALKAALQSTPKLPFYLYSGEKDVFVPVETFAEEVQLLGARITYRQFSESGHEGFYTEKQVWSDLLTVH